MIYQPSDKELKKIEALNKGYAKIKEGLKIIKKAVPKDDDIALHIYRIEKEHEKIVKRMQQVLETQYVNEEFTSIVKASRKRQGKRFNRKKK